MKDVGEGGRIRGQPRKAVPGNAINHSTAAYTRLRTSERVYCR